MTLRGWLRPTHGRPLLTRSAIAVVSGALLLRLSSIAPADAVQSGSEGAANSAAAFVRLTRDETKSPVALETAVVSHRVPTGSTGLTVDLVAAMHIAEKSYYQQLNREFAAYDAVLYELVASENNRVPKRGESGGHHPLVLLQNGLKDLLGLQFQLGEIDYARKNMVHADMSPDEFARSMEQRGESALSMLARMIGYALSKQSQSRGALDGGQLLLALLDKNRALAMKRLMAEQFEDSDSSLAALDGPTGSTLIAGRNEVAVEVLRKQIAAGKRKIAIFYGAGHMPDIQKRLREGFGLQPVSTRWLVAWDLKSDARTTKP